MAKSKNKRRRKVLVFAGIGVVIAGLAILAVFKRREPVIRVETQKAARRDLIEKVVANGRIQPVVRVVINPEVPGEIVALPVREGQTVKKGEVLLRIKSDNYVASRNSAEASYLSTLAGQAVAQANLEKAQFEFDRVEKLFAADLVSDSEFLTAKTSLAVAKASHESSTHQAAQAQAALDRADDELRKTTIVAPMDGTVVNLISELGERVVGSSMMPGTEIMTVANLNVMEAWVDIGEMDIVLIAPGQKAHLEVDAFRDRKFTGEVTEIANTARTTGMGSQQEATKFEVKILVAEKENFRPGMSVTAEIETRRRTNVVTVPIQSVTTRLLKKEGSAKPASSADASSRKSEETMPRGKGGKGAESAEKPAEVVFVVAEGQVKAVPVERGISDDEYVEIVSGLSEGQEVVSGGYNAIMRELEDGKRVEVTRPDNQSKDQTSPLKKP